MNNEQALRDYAAHLIGLHGHQHGNPSWDIITESWEGDAPLTQSELDFVYGLWATAKVTVSWE
jgi:hypothetical protein